MDKSPDAFKTISEAAEALDLPQHVLRFWETRFPQIKPMKRGGGRRYYRPEDVELLASIRHLLYGEGYTIKGVQRILKQQHGARAVIELVQQLRSQRAPAGAVALASAIAFADHEGDEAERTVFSPMPLQGGFAPKTSVVMLSHAHRRQLEDALESLDDCIALLAAANAA